MSLTIHIGKDKHLNITHNLTLMAKKVPIGGYYETLYDALWNSKNNIVDAGSLYIPLYIGLKYLYKKRKILSRYNPPNGWGTYDNLVAFTEYLFLATIKYPKTKVEVYK